MGIGYVPLSNMYESMVFFAWSIVGLYLLFERFYRSKALGAFLLPLGFLSMGTAVSTLSPEIRPLMPALQSSWLVYHVITCFLGYAAFAISFGVSLVYLFKKGEPFCGESPAFPQDIGRHQLQGHHGRVSALYGRDHYGRDLGQLCLGNLLELGP